VAFNIFVGVLLLFSIGNFIFFILNPLQYHFSLPTLRKGLYTIFIGAISLGLLIGEVTLSNWKFLLTLAIVIVFMDLAILLTPSILKLWNAEFKYGEYVENVIKTNEKIHKGTMNRVGTMSELIQNAGTYFSSLLAIAHSETMKRQLQDYLNLYARQYGFSVQLWELERQPYDPNRIPFEERNQLNQQELEAYLDNLSIMEAIEKVLMEMEHLNTFEFGEQKEAYIQSLFRLEIVSLQTEDSMIVPVFLEDDDNDMLILLNNTTGELLEVDAVHITNLVYLFHSYR
jgi:hypothetical protein